MAIIDVVKCDAAVLSGKRILAWKFPSSELSTWTQLVVNETQEAFLVNGGVIEGPYLAGTHTLSTKNIPLISSFLKLPFGQSPFSAEVWFINKIVTLDIKWGTSDPILLLDPVYKMILPIRAFGQCGFQIGDSKTFLTRLVGISVSFDYDDIRNYFRGLILTCVKDCISRNIVRNHISILEISASLNEMSSELTAEISKEIQKFGLVCCNFYVNSINVPDDDASIIKLRNALAKKAEMEIVGYDYHQERSFDTMERAAGNEGNAASSAFIGGGVGLGVGSAIAQRFSGVIQQFGGKGHAPAGGDGYAGEVRCPNCSGMNKVNSKFCVHCGGQLAGKGPVVCPQCQSIHPPEASFCSFCGTSLPGKQ